MDDAAMDGKTFRIEVEHLRRVVEALRVLDLNDLQRRAQTLGSPADRALIDSILLALELLPTDHSR